MMLVRNVTWASLFVGFSRITALLAYIWLNIFICAQTHILWIYLYILRIYSYIQMYIMPGRIIVLLNRYFWVKYIHISNSFTISSTKCSSFFFLARSQFGVILCLTKFIQQLLHNLQRWHFVLFFLYVETIYIYSIVNVICEDSTFQSFQCCMYTHFRCLYTFAWHLQIVFVAAHHVYRQPWKAYRFIVTLSFPGRTISSMVTKAARKELNLFLWCKCICLYSGRS